MFPSCDVLSHGQGTPSLSVRTCQGTKVEGPVQAISVPYHPPRPRFLITRRILVRSQRPLKEMSWFTKALHIRSGPGTSNIYNKQAQQRESLQRSLSVEDFPTMPSNKVLAIFCDGTGMDGVLADPGTRCNYAYCLAVF